MEENMTLVDIAKLFDYAYDCIDFYRRMIALPSCNDCAKNPSDCVYLPDWGEPLRINCPLWQGKDKND